MDAESRFEMLEIIDQESDQLNRFISDLIDLARIEAGELRLRRRWGAVDEIISTALTRAKSLTTKHHVKIDTEKELPVVRVDANAVSEVVYTLVDNGCEVFAAAFINRHSGAEWSGRNGDDGSGGRGNGH